MIFLTSSHFLLHSACVGRVSTVFSFYYLKPVWNTFLVRNINKTKHVSNHRDECGATREIKIPVPHFGFSLISQWENKSSQEYKDDIHNYYHTCILEIHHCLCLTHKKIENSNSSVGNSQSYPESHSKNVFGVSWPTQDGHADNVLSEVYGAVSVLDRVNETQRHAYLRPTAAYCGGVYSGNKGYCLV